VTGYVTTLKFHRRDRRRDHGEWGRCITDPSPANDNAALLSQASEPYSILLISLTRVHTGDATSHARQKASRCDALYRRVIPAQNFVTGGSRSWKGGGHGERGFASL